MAPSLETQTLDVATTAFETRALNGNGVAKGNTHGRIATDVGDLKDRLHVERSTKAFGSRAVSLVDLPAGSLFLKITKATPATKAYTSVQTSENTHIELNSDIVFINHSCKPSVIFDMERMEVRVSSARDLKKGDALTFFYPSSEWDMAQPFNCKCGEKECKGTIDGAGKMIEEVVRGYWLNVHIEKLLDAKNGGQGGSRNKMKNGN
jgi:hypothetical protein